jgi:hypothetical protein
MYGIFVRIDIPVIDPTIPIDPPTYVALSGPVLVPILPNMNNVGS